MPCGLRFCVREWCKDHTVNILCSTLCACKLANMVGGALALWVLDGGHCGSSTVALYTQYSLTPGYKVGVTTTAVVHTCGIGVGLQGGSKSHALPESGLALVRQCTRSRDFVHNMHKPQQHDVVQVLAHGEMSVTTCINAWMY